MSTSSTIDILFAAYLVFSIFWGYFVGAVSEVFSLAGLLIILAVSMRTYNYIAIALTNSFGLTNVTAYVAAFALVFCTIYIALRIVKWLVEKKIARSDTLNGANRNFGMMIGFVKGAFVVLVICIAIILAPLSEQTRAKVSDSVFLKVSKSAEPFVIGLFGDRELLQAAAKMNENPEESSRKISQSPEFQKLISHPKMQELANDPEIKAAVTKKDVMALMSNKKFLQLMNDEEIMKIIRTIDLPKLMSESSKIAIPPATSEVGTPGGTGARN